MFQTLKRLFGKAKPDTASPTTLSRSTTAEAVPAKPAEPPKPKIVVPEAERPLHAVLTGRPVRRILEIGLGDGSRADRLTSVWTNNSSALALEYLVIDPFESADDSAGLLLRNFHRRMRSRAIQARLLPGQPLPVLRQEANRIGHVDLVILSEEAMAEFDALGFWLARLVHPATAVMAERTQNGTTRFVEIPHQELERLARYRRAA